MKIQVLSVSVQTVPTAKGSYQVADVAFKNLTFQGKVEGKKIMSFGATKDSFGVLATAQKDDIFEVTIVKNDKGYNDWVAMTKGDANASPQQGTSSTNNQTNVGGSTGRVSTYETAEERAKKQVYIVRQSSVGSALTALSCGAKSPPKVDEVLDYAQKLEYYVFNGPTMEKINPFPVESFPDMPQ